MTPEAEAAAEKAGAAKEPGRDGGQLSYLTLAAAEHLIRPVISRFLNTMGLICISMTSLQRSLTCAYRKGWQND